MKKTPLYLALGLAASPIYAQGVDKSAANFKEGQFSDYLTLIDKAIDSSEGADLPEGFDKTKLYEVLGLSTIKSYAQSSTPDGAEWINHIHLNNGGASEGILKILTSSKHKGLSAPQMAPAGSDLAMQLSLNLESVEPMLREIIKMGGEADLAELDSGLSEEVPMVGGTTSELLKKLDLRLNLVIDLDGADQLNTPFGAFDRPHLTGRIDGISWIWEKVGAMAIGGTGLPFTKTEEGAVTSYTLPAEMAAQFMGFSPTIRVDKEKDQIWLGTTPEFLTKCVSGENTLADSDAFKSTFKGLPTDGAAMTYASKDFYNFFGKSVLGALEQQGIMEMADEATKLQIEKAKKQMNVVANGTAQVISSDASGVLFSERGVQNIEQQLADALEAFENAQKQLNDAGDDAESTEAAESAPSE